MGLTWAKYYDEAPNSVLTSHLTRTYLMCGRKAWRRLWVLDVEILSNISGCTMRGGTAVVVTISGVAELTSGAVFGVAILLNHLIGAALFLLPEREDVEFVLLQRAATCTAASILARGRGVGVRVELRLRRTRLAFCSVANALLWLCTVLLHQRLTLKYFLVVGLGTRRRCVSAFLEWLHRELCGGVQDGAGRY